MDINYTDDNKIYELKQLPDDHTYIAHEKTYMEKWALKDKNGLDLYKLINYKNKDNEKKIMIDGPPFVSGSLHCGHGAVISVKSVMYNYYSMNGFNCEYKIGYDTHGLPIENLVCKENNLTTLEEVQQIGLEKFNKLCDDTIDKYSKSWTPTFKMLGRLGDFDDVYMTRDLNFMESCFWIFKQLWDNNLVYKGNKVMAYSWACQTPLSNFEASQNYQEKETKSIYVMFNLVERSNEYLVAWTTTPWTLPANLAICVNENLDYVKIKTMTKINNQDNLDRILIIGKNLVHNLFGKKDKYEIISEFKGSALVGLKYEPVFEYMSDMIKKEIENKQNQSKKFFTILSDSYVTEDGIGTAIVHLAPAFGEDDYRVCFNNGLIDNVTIDDFCPIDRNGKYTNIVYDYDGRLVFDCEDDIRIHLKKESKLLKTQLYTHNYPYCYRTDTPLIYRTMESFYIRVSHLKDRLIKLNNDVSWHPKEIGTGRFHHWLLNVKDWSVSRFRYYGTPLPIWKSEDNDMICIGSIEELKTLSGVDKIDNLHPQYINDIIIIKDNKTYRRIPDIFDCWFESGAVPFAQLHYPFDKSDKSVILTTRQYLSDFICEGMDQTRGWFYTLLVLSAAILNKAPYKNVLCTGMVLDKDGKKMAKRLGNVVDPVYAIEKYGADVIRTYFVSSQLLHAESLKFNEENIEKLKKRFTPYINAVRFWIEYSIKYQKDFNDVYKHNINDNLINLMDRWIINKLHMLVSIINVYMNCYKLGLAVESLIDFIDDLTNWYIKLNRDRIKGLKGNNERVQSIHVLYYVLINYCKLWTPFTPFLSEHIFQHLKVFSKKYRNIESVLLDDYPNINNLSLNILNSKENTVIIMTYLQRITQIVRNLRDRSSKHSKMGVPFSLCIIYHNDHNYLKSLEQHIDIIKSELNCMQFEFKKLHENVLFKVIPDKKNIGIDFRKDAKKIIELIENQNQQTLMNIYNNIDQLKTENNIILSDKYFKISCVPKKEIDTDNIQSIIDDDLMVSINSTYNDMIHYIYQINCLHSSIQNIRKEMKLHPWDKIKIYLDEQYATDKIKESLHQMLSNAEISIVKYDIIKDTFKDIFNDVFKENVNLATLDGLYENGIYKLYATEYKWQTISGNENIGRIFVYYS